MNVRAAIAIGAAAAEAAADADATATSSIRVHDVREAAPAASRIGAFNRSDGVT